MTEQYCVSTRAFRLEHRGFGSTWYSSTLTKNPKNQTKKLLPLHLKKMREKTVFSSNGCVAEITYILTCLDIFARYSNDLSLGIS